MTRKFDFTATFNLNGEEYEGKGKSPWDAWRDLLAAMRDCDVPEWDMPEDPADCEWLGENGNPITVERINMWEVDGESLGVETPADDDTPADIPPDEDYHDDAWHDGYYDGWYAAMGHARELAEAAAADLNAELSDTSPPEREDR